MENSLIVVSLDVGDAPPEQLAAAEEAGSAT
jgi:hypothetical protein